MTRLRIQFVPFYPSLEPHYEVIDEDGTRYGEPKPYDAARKAMRQEQAFLEARELEDYATARMLMG